MTEELHMPDRYIQCGVSPEAYAVRIRNNRYPQENVPNAMPILCSLLDAWYAEEKRSIKTKMNTNALLSVGRLYLSLWIRQGRHTRGVIPSTSAEDLCAAAGFLGQRKAHVLKKHLDFLLEKGFLYVREREINGKMSMLGYFLADPFQVLEERHHFLKDKEYRKGDYGYKAKQYAHTLALWLITGEV